LKVKSILVSQPQPVELEKSPYWQLSKKHSIDVDFHKFINVVGVSAKDFRKSRIYILDYSAVIFTSRNAVDHFFRICKEMRIEVPDTMKYFCISEAIAFYLQKYIQYRKRKIFYGKQNFTDLMETIKKHKDEKFLLPCSDIHKQNISKLLDEHQLKYKKAVIYKTIPSDLSKISIESYDMLIFFSPSGVQSLFKNFPEFEQGAKLIGAFGPTTSKAIEDAGLKLNIKAPTKTAPSMTMAIEQYLAKNNRR
jgi:uroporphyrinogen-III synthase